MNIAANIASNTTASIASERAKRLIEQFEDQIVRGLHMLRTRYVNSDAGRALREAGPFVLGEIAEHLEAVKDRQDYGGYNSASELRQAWIWLLRGLGRAHNLHHAPDENANILEWAAWARRNAARRAA